MQFSLSNIEFKVFDLIQYLTETILSFCHLKLLDIQTFSVASLRYLALFYVKPFHLVQFYLYHF